jgi:hypothetical protein
VGQRSEAEVWQGGNEVLLCWVRLSSIVDFETGLLTIVAATATVLLTSVINCQALASALLAHLPIQHF